MGMSRRWLLVLLAALVTPAVGSGASCGARAETVTVDALMAMDEPAFSDWFTHYYRAPHPELIRAAIRKVSQSGYLTDQNKVPPIAGFLANAFAARPEALEQTVADAALALPDQDFQVIQVIAILALNADPKQQGKLAGRLDAFGKRVLAWFEAAGIHGHDRVAAVSPYALDFIWGAFFATGDSDLVLPLVGAIADPKDQDVLHLMVSKAANWSLGSNAQQHPKILALCKAQIAQQPPEIAEKLKKIVAKASTP